MITRYWITITRYWRYWLLGIEHSLSRKISQWKDSWAGQCNSSIIIAGSNFITEVHIITAGTNLAPKATRLLKSWSNFQSCLSRQTTENLNTQTHTPLIFGHFVYQFLDLTKFPCYLYEEIVQSSSDGEKLFSSAFKLFIPLPLPLGNKISRDFQSFTLLCPAHHCHTNKAIAPPAGNNQWNFPNLRMS